MKIAKNNKNSTKIRKRSLQMRILLKKSKSFGTLLFKTLKMDRAISKEMSPICHMKACLILLAALGANQVIKYFYLRL